MRRNSGIIVALLASLVFIGCSKGDATPGANGSPTNPVSGGPAGKVNIAANAGPDVVVDTFLNATKKGDEATATALLTTKAREETTKEGLVLDPPGTPTMKYKIAKVDYIDEKKDGAYVNSIWTDTDGSKEDSMEIVWVLRKQLDGWRIAGMAAQLTSEEPPVFLNFEDPVDVLRIKEKINQGDPSDGNAQPAPNTAQQPATNTPLR
jgi:hypothetical protein